MAMRVQIPPSEPGSWREETVRRASAGLLLVNSLLFGQVMTTGGLRVAGWEVGDLVALPLAALGIALGLKLCGWARSFRLGHGLIFLYTFAMFTALIPYLGVHWVQRAERWWFLWRRGW